MAKTVLGVFDTVEDAEKAASELQRRGFSKTEISAVAKEASARQASREAGQEEEGGMGRLTSGITTGGILGGAAGLLASVGALTIPGIGPVLAAGPVAAVLGGAVTGGIAGGLLDWGIPENVGRRYEERVKEGKVVTMVRTDDLKADQAADVLRRYGAKEVETH